MIIDFYKNEDVEIYYPNIDRKYNAISMSLDGYFLNQMRFHYYLCKDSTCQIKKRFDGFQILNINYMKILITDPFLEGNLVVQELRYYLNSENYRIERMIIPTSQHFHNYK